MSEIIVDKILVPHIIMYKNNVYYICDFHKKYIIRQYKVVINENEKIYKVFIDAAHPNANPQTSEFCISDQLKELAFDSFSQSVLENMLITFRIDDCYFTPWGEVSYDQK